MSESLPLVLGSTSPYRRQLLEKLHLDFITAAPDIDETRLPDEAPKALVHRLSLEKAKAVARDCPRHIIIASDQVAVCDGQVLGKPGDHARAVAQLRFLSGKTVTFYTGLCVYNSATGKAQVEVVPFEVVFRSLHAEEIEHYLQREQPYNCAGSFKSEGLGIALFERLNGEDPNTLIGLPLIRLVAMLGRENIRVL